MGIGDLSVLNVVKFLFAGFTFCLNYLLIVVFQTKVN